jgi:hypothetical protein
VNKLFELVSIDWPRVAVELKGLLETGQALPRTGELPRQAHAPLDKYLR